MLKKGKIILGLTLIILSISMITVQSEGQSEAFERLNREAIESNVANGLSDNYLTEIPLFLNYTLHEPILITNDDKLAETSSYGTGTESDPFVISGWSFNYTQIAISISWTTKYFVIRECLLMLNISYSHGISLNNIADGTARIEKNIFQGNSNDILIYECDYVNICDNSMRSSSNNLRITHSKSNHIIENNFSNFFNSIILDNTNNILVCDNSFLSGKYSSIELYRTVNSTIHNNYFGQNSGVMDEWYNQDLVVTNNVFNQSSRVGLSLPEYVFEGIIANNVFYNSGIIFSSAETSGLNNLEVYNNTVNGLPLGWMIDEQNITLTENYGQLILMSCSGIVVENQEINNWSTGIILKDCYDVIVRNNILVGCYEGIKLRFSNNIEIYNNSCIRSFYGISCFSSFQNIKIYNNTCSFNLGHGISLESEIHSAVIENNHCMNNLIGIKIYGVENTIIVNNTLKYNLRGIDILLVDDCEIIANKILSNAIGINMYYYTNDNLIYNNAFIDNNVQAVDYGKYNQWCNLETNIGNYWSDYSGVGSYKIGGQANSEDYCPLNEQMEPYPGGPFYPVVDTLDDEQPLRRSEKFELGWSENLFVTLVGCFYVLVYFKRKKKQSRLS